MMSPRVKTLQKGLARRGAAAVELALLLPVLIFCSMITVDFARVAYVLVALQNSARNGAVYEFCSKAGLPLPIGWTSLSVAVSADALAGMTFTGSATSPASAPNNYVPVPVQTT